MGGVRTLVGRYDGTTEAAVMVNGLNDVPFGPMFTGPDASDQIEAFLVWMRGPGMDEIVAKEGGVPPALVNEDIYSSDPRSLSATALDFVVSWWRDAYAEDNRLDGWLREMTPQGKDD